MHSISLSSSFWWFVSQAVIWFLAAIGGVVVLVGLWMEYKGGKVGYFHKAKKLTEHGEIWVMVGVAIEVIVGIGFAAREGWEARQIKAEIVANDPRNWSLNSVTAVAIFRYRTNKNGIEALAADLNAHINAQGSWPTRGFIKTEGPIIDIISFGPPEMTKILSNDVADVQFAIGFTWDPATRPYFDQILAILNRTNVTAAMFADSASEITLIPPFLDSKIKIDGGFMDVSFNSSTNKRFLIPPQTPSLEIKATSERQVGSNASQIHK